MIDVSKEIIFKTTRSGGKGGQNVNKVETAVIAFFNIAGSFLLTEEQKILLKEKLLNRINGEGYLLVKSQKHRTQLANKDEAAEKLNDLINKALTPKKKRLATKASRASKQKRLDEKKINAEIKSGRKKINRERFS